MTNRIQYYPPIQLLIFVKNVLAVYQLEKSAKKINIIC